MTKSSIYSKYKILLIGIIIFIILYGIINSFLLTKFSSFDEDEFQHVHIAWNIFNGKILYKDFFEHHGPIYSLLNGLIFKSYNLSPSFNSIFILRYISFVCMLALLLISFLIGKEFFKSSLWGIISVAILSSLIFFQDSATEIRPDIIQNIFWLTGFLLLLKSLSHYSSLKNYFAGIFFGLAILTNSKAALGPFAVIIFFLVFYFLKKSELKKILKSISLLFIGGITSFILISVYFIINKSFTEFLFYNFEFNLIAILKYHSQQAPYYVKQMIFKQPVFLIFTLIGIYLLGKKIVQNYKSDFIDHSKAELYLLVVSVVTAFSALLGMYMQHYLQFLTLLSIFTVYAIKELYRILYENKLISHKLIYVVSIFILTFNLIYAEYKETPLKKSVKLISQEKLTTFILQNTNRAEPILFIWNNCGGFMFNEDIQYYWMENEGFGKYFNKINGYEVFGDSLITNMKTKKVNYIIAGEDELKNVLSKDALSYIKDNYTANYNGYKCLWKK